jgi:hypothetical protein
MARALMLVVTAAVLCAAGRASARTPGGCDEDDAAVSLPGDLLRTPLAEVRPAPGDDEPRPPEARLCVTGSTKDASCRPHSTLPPPGRLVLSIFSETFVAARPPGLDAPAARRLPRRVAQTHELSPGFARRLERPPRSLPVLA